MASLGRRLQEAFKQSMVKAFQFVDDFLVIRGARSHGVAVEEDLSGAFFSVLRDFLLTRELPVGGQPRFLDLRL